MELPNSSGTTPTPKPNESETTAASPEKTVPVTPPVEEKASAPVLTPAKKSILPGTKLTKEDKNKLIKIKKQALQRVMFVKQATFLLLLLSVGWFFWLQINLSESNSVLSLLDVKENMGQEITRLQKAKMKMKLEKKKLEKKTKKLELQLETKIYTQYTSEIKNIRDQQIQWFDEVDENGALQFGLTDAVPRIQEYFNSRTYTDPSSILSGKHGDIQIKNLQASRDGVNFSVVGSQILGKVFFLNIEFVEMVNSFPSLKKGQLTQFARQKNTDDDDSMNFSVRLERQLPEEVDPADERFEEYLSWLNSVTNK